MFFLYAPFTFIFVINVLTRIVSIHPVSAGVLTHDLLIKNTYMYGGLAFVYP
jgi:hypothetical protein